MAATIRIKKVYYVVLATTLALSIDAVDAGELLLKKNCQVAGPIVRLGDVADIFADDGQLVEQMSRIELLPTPAVRRRIDIDEIRRLLAVRSVNLADWRISGSATVEIVAGGSGGIQQTAYGNRALHRGQADVARRRVEQAIVEHLQAHADPGHSWVVAVQLDDAAARAVLQRYSQLSVDGGADPWVGRQHFTLAVNTREGSRNVLIDADVSLPEMVVVARRSLGRGDVVTAADVELQPKPERGVLRNPVYLVKDVIGKELVRGVTTGRPLEANYLQSPRLVRANDIVTVFSIAGGVTVRTIGRAKEAGGRGDVITVVDQKTRKPFRSKARVVAFQTVEIYALGPTTARFDNLQATEK